MESEGGILPPDSILPTKARSHDAEMSKAGLRLELAPELREPCGYIMSPKRRRLGDINLPRVQATRRSLRVNIALTKREQHVHVHEEMPVFDFLEAAASLADNIHDNHNIGALTPITSSMVRFSHFSSPETTHLSDSHARMCASVSIFCLKQASFDKGIADRASSLAKQNVKFLNRYCLTASAVVIILISLILICFSD